MSDAFVPYAPLDTLKPVAENIWIVDGRRADRGRLLPPRTAILTDLIENFEPARIKSRFWRWVIGWSGAVDPDGKAPIGTRATCRHHRGALPAAAETMIGRNPERVILAHGRWYDRDGTAELRRAFRWAF